VSFFSDDKTLDALLEKGGAALVFKAVYDEHYDTSLDLALKVSGSIFRNNSQMDCLVALAILFEHAIASMPSEEAFALQAFCNFVKEARQSKLRNLN
jgi:hypothetical protein